ncbi:Putative Alpha-galactosidase [Aspergillus calidoustus]|uniref:Alpha-galactosidase n=1 Tax=Aspergillus calidoustus TaxID=454130 RepID=A0A0U4ZWN6_ASPCI|nr:Putative Alpha-galactosidase [Aspergillus calidoustus]
MRFSLAALLLAAAGTTASKLAQTPQMGFNTWNSFKANYNESTITHIASLLISLGLHDAGYNYLLLDEGWSDMSRTDDGYLQSNQTTFPDGIAPLADRVHDMGLKLGLYGDSGILTCGFRPGSWGYEERDARTLASWGVDYWKYDNCGGFQAMSNAPQERFGLMRDALERSGREIFYSVCEWGFQFPWHWGGDIGHSYRMSGDITAKFINETGCPCKTAYCLNTGYAGCSVTSILRKMREISVYQERGHWLDMDMLEVGVGEMTVYMEQTHFAFWAALKSPLIIGADLRTLRNESLAVLTNRDIIAINQDSLGKPVHFIEGVSVEGSVQVWAGEVKGGNVVLVFNEKSYPQDVHVSLKELGLGIERPVRARELWSGKSWGKIDRVKAQLGAYQTLVFRITR